MLLGKKLLYGYDSIDVSYFSLEASGGVTGSYGSTKPSIGAMTARYAATKYTGQYTTQVTAVSRVPTYPIYATKDVLYLFSGSSIISYNIPEVTQTSIVKNVRGGVTAVNQVVPNADYVSIYSRYSASSSGATTLYEIRTDRATGATTATQVGSTIAGPGVTNTTRFGLLKNGSSYAQIYYTQTGMSSSPSWYYNNNNTKLSFAAGMGFIVNKSETELYRVIYGNIYKITPSGSTAKETLIASLDDRIGNLGALYESNNGVETILDYSTNTADGPHICKYNMNGTKIWTTEQLMGEDGVAYNIRILGRYKDSYYVILAPGSSTSTAILKIIQINVHTGKITNKFSMPIPDNLDAYSYFSSDGCTLPLVSTNGYFVVTHPSTSGLVSGNVVVARFAQIKINLGSSHNIKPTL